MREDREIQAVTRRVASLLAAAREHRGISKEELSRRSGISAPGIRLIEQHKREASLYVLLLISGAMGIDLSRIIREARRDCRVLLRGRKTGGGASRGR